MHRDVQLVGYIHLPVHCKFVRKSSDSVEPQKRRIDIQQKYKQWSSIVQHIPGDTCCTKFVLN